MTSPGEEADDGDSPRHVLRELGFTVRRRGDELVGWAPLVAEMHVPGTGHLRTSVLATWADMLTGLLAAQEVGPAVPVTVELDVQLYAPAPGSGTVWGVGRTVRRGRSVFVAEVEFSAEGGDVFAIGGASFMVSPDRTARLPARLSTDLPASGPRLSAPLAERVGCQRRSPGVAVLPKADDGLNSSGTISGGLIALVAEEAVVSVRAGESLCSLALRYLQPVREGPLVATARVRDRLATVELRDEGAEHRLSVVATARTFGSG